MGVYTRAGSPYWWMRVHGRRASTKILVDAPTAVQRRDNKRLAEQVYHTRMAALAREQHDLPRTRETITFAAFADWYRDNVSVHKRGHVRECEILKTLQQGFGTRRLDQLGKADVREWMTARRRTVTASTVNRELILLKAVLKAAVPRYVATSSIVGLPGLRTVKRDMCVLSHAEEARLLPCLAPADHTLVILAIDTLIRLGDLLALLWTQDHGGYLSVIDPKIGPYDVPVSTRVREALDTMPRPGAYIFPAHRKLPAAAQRRQAVRRMLERACRKARVPYGRGRGITFHSLRHTGTSRMVEAGVDLRTVQAIGGWSSLTQLTRYAHPTARTMQDAVNLISRRKSAIAGTQSAHTPKTSSKR